MESLFGADPARAYGTWPSAISADLLAEDVVRLGQIRTEADRVYWLEGRPSENGRGVIVCFGDDRRRRDLTPAGWSVRSRVHEYGGGDFFVHRGALFFSNDDDQRLYRQDPDGEPVPLTPAGNWRYADGLADERRGRAILVVEDHGRAGEAENTLGVVPLDRPAAPRPLVRGNDFYASPALSADGQWLAWLTWNHPCMPWNGCELWLARLEEDGRLSDAHCIAGGDRESVFQPRWSADGTLYFVSDRSGWWNLYRWRGGTAEGVLTGPFETGLPQWVFGMSTYALVSDRTAAVAVNESGIWRLVEVDLETGTSRRLRLPWSVIDGLEPVPHGIVCRAGSPREPEALTGIDLSTGRTYVVRRSVDLRLDADCISHPQHLTFPSADGHRAHAFFYAPTHPDCVGPPDQKPPLMVLSHGGPTAAASTALNLRIQYWTSRGFAVLDVNYRGSTGFGRAYRERLFGHWGVADVEDCIAGAAHLADNGAVDPRRKIIAGRSAGGFTTLAALVFHDAFQAGASYYGISDLETLTRDTHKFESRYNDWLVGPYPERRALYRERSPLAYADRLSCPVIFLQGLQDQIVPPNQAEAMVEALRAKGLPVAYVAFEEEGHGFRRAESIVASIEAELAFYGQVFRFDPADELDPIAIHNLKWR